MPENERKAENDSCKRNQGCKGILSIENKQEYKDNEYQCHSDQDGIEFCYGRADILDGEQLISSTSERRRPPYFESSNKGLALPVYPLDSVTHFFLADVAIPIFIKKSKGIMLLTENKHYIAWNTTIETHSLGGRSEVRNEVFKKFLVLNRLRSTVDTHHRLQDVIYAE
jgi:hypothetical protein